MNWLSSLLVCRRCSAVIPVAILLSILGACAPIPVRLPEPTPVWITVYASPVWRPLTAELTGCRPAGSALAYVDRPDEAQVALVWGNEVPPGWRAFQLGLEDLAVVVNPQNPAQSISSDGLRMVYSGEIRDWDFLGQAPGPVTAWGDSSDGEIAQVARGAGLEISNAGRLAPGPAELRAALAADPTAIGLLPRRWIDTTVRELSITGWDTATAQAPLLALTPAEPEGLLRDWLFCLQERINR